MYTSDDPNFLRIFHLDAGRKYFGLPAITTILDAMADAGLNRLELYFSDNQGFRFGLDDPTVRTAHGRYDLTPALGDGYCQEDKAPDGAGKFWTEPDMEKILHLAQERNIGVIPVLNMPGHLGAILTRFPQLCHPGSRSSIDLQNPEAVEFALALLQKYAAWFAARGCRYFHFGGDEFANDLGFMGLDRLYESGGMGGFVDFVNRAAGVIRALGLIPMAFNDGIYYHGDTSNGFIDPSIHVCYWIAGWNGYSPAPAGMLAGMGFPMINACHRYYCGVGDPDWPGKVRRAAEFDPTRFDREEVIPNPAGAMLCLWSDRGNADGQDDGIHAAQQISPVIRAFGAAIGRTDSIKNQ